MCGFYVNIAKNVGVFINMAMDVRVFVNMAINMRVFVLSKLQRMCGEFVNMAINVQLFVNIVIDYSSFSIWQRILILIQCGNTFAANVQCAYEYAIYFRYTNECSGQ